MKTILILEDNDERISAFQKTVTTLGADLELKVWYDAPSMIAQAEEFFPTAALISLDHDLNPKPGITVEPGTGVDASAIFGRLHARLSSVDSFVEHGSGLLHAQRVAIRWLDGGSRRSAWHGLD